MATTKKAKRKTKAKRKKATAKAATRRKTKAVRKTVRKTKTVRKKPAKKAPLRQTSPKKARPPTKRTAVTATPSPPAQGVPPGERIGVVTHYYSHLSVATLRLESGTLRVGDMIHILESLEVDHAPVTEVGPNDDFGLRVVDHAREHDVVYKLPR